MLSSLVCRLYLLPLVALAFMGLACKYAFASLREHHGITDANFQTHSMMRGDYHLVSDNTDASSDRKASDSNLEIRHFGCERIPLSRTAAIFCRHLAHATLPACRHRKDSR